jgi:hypothetical protein
MAKISLFEYAVVNNPKDVYQALQQTGFKKQLNPMSKEGQVELHNALRYHTQQNPKSGYKLIALVHPDKELVMSFNGDNNACGCNANGEDEETVLAGATSTEEKSTEGVPEFLSKDDSKPLLSKNQTVNVLMGVGIGVVLIAIIKGIVK